jgi:hypothetical protein
MFVKNYLVGYKTRRLLLLSDDVDYFLRIKRVWFWGLLITHNSITYTLTPHHNYAKYFKYWDGLIESQKAISI